MCNSNVCVCMCVCVCVIQYITARVHNKNPLIIVIVVVVVDTPNLDILPGKIQVFCIGTVAAQVITQVVSAAEGMDTTVFPPFYWPHQSNN